LLDQVGFGRAHPRFFRVFGSGESDMKLSFFWPSWDMFGSIVKLEAENVMEAGNNVYLSLCGDEKLAWCFWICISVCKWARQDENPR
jgi:hypothetical protein